MSAESFGAHLTTKDQLLKKNLTKMCWPNAHTSQLARGRVEHAHAHICSCAHIIGTLCVFRGRGLRGGACHP